MLRALGGDVVDMDAASEAPAPEASPAASPAADTAGEDEDEEPGDEPPEFLKNDFASDPEMIKDFLTNSDELLETLDAKVLELEQDPRNKETIESIFRAAHTLKGAAGMFGFKALERVMHRMENLFDQVRKGVLVPSPATIDVVFQGLDVLRALLDAVRNGKPSGMNTRPIVRALSLAAKGRADKSPRASRAGGEAKTKTASAPAPTESHGGPATGGGGAAGGAAGGGDGPRKSAEQSTIRVDLERLDMLVNLVGELVIDRTRFVSIEEELRSVHPQPKAASAMTETVQLFGRHMNEIHEIIMKIRMVPIGNAFNKFTRIVRDLARQLGKEIELYLDGEATELDKTLVEQIGDPLIHLIRNSCDHGIEMPDARETNGKARGGKIFLSAQQEGNHIIITIEDDGKGIPVDVVRRKAVERGLIKEDAQMSQRDIINLIFEPGFSTAEKVTTVSGRGVGMDVVKKQIGKLKGSIEIDSAFGKGTTTRIRLPLTLAIVQSLLVEVSGETFAVPLSTVIESVRIKPEDIQTVGDAEVIKRHGKVLPLLYLADALDIATRDARTWYAEPARRELERRGGDARAKHVRRKDRMYVVIVGSGERRFGIVVDQLLNQQEMVIKPLGPLMHQVPGVAGGAVLGNGEVVLVLDIQDLTDNFRTRTRLKGAA
jgi:two-component system chemotaxis sensor kinase CheA